MSILGLLCLLLALIAALTLVLYGLQRRALGTLARLSKQLQHSAGNGQLPGRVDLESGRPEIAALVRAVNHLLARAARGTERDGAPPPALFADLGGRIHEAVLTHREVIVYANRQFANLIGVDRLELVGRKLADPVPPEYSELVGENLRRRLAGGPAAEPPLLALRSLAEAIIATDKEGRITFLNPAAEQLTGSPASATQGKLLEEIVSLVDETDRRLLSDPVHQALTT